MVGLSLFYLSEEAAPAHALTPTHPDERGFADDHRLRDKSPEAGVLASVAVVAHHPIVIVVKGVVVDLLVVEIVFAVAHFEAVALVDADGALIDGVGSWVEGDRRAPARDEQRAIVIE